MPKKTFNMPSTKSLLDSIAGRVEETPEQDQPSAAESKVVEPAPIEPVSQVTEPEIDPSRKYRNTTGFYLAPDILHKLDGCAMMQHKSRSEVCRIALQEYFERHHELLEKYELFLKL